MMTLRKTPSPAGSRETHINVDLKQQKQFQKYEIASPTAEEVFMNDRIHNNQH